MNWNKLKFKEFITLQRGFDLPVDEMNDGEVPVLGSTGVIGYHNKTKVNPPGVVTGRSGTIGVIQYTDKPYWPHNTSLWVKDFKSNCPKFVYYKMQTLNLDRFNGGASVPTLNRNNLVNLIVQVPDIPMQEKIASILSSYDDLIDTNRRRIHLLEKSARLLFREWFVYFRFPGHEKVKIVDGVPDGWKKTTLGNIANRIKKNYSMNDEDLNLVDLARINSRTLAITNVGVASDLETARIIFEKDDVLFSSIRPYLHKVVLAPFRGITNTSVFVIRSKNPIYRAYTTLLLFSDYAIQFANQHSTGTKMPVVKWGSVSKLPVLIPHQTIMEDFQNMIWPMLEQIQLSYFQNQKLAQARDLLLPRLMSGEIEV